VITYGCFCPAIACNAGPGILNGSMAGGKLLLRFFPRLKKLSFQPITALKQNLDLYRIVLEWVSDP